jgi:hypothetical protein
MVDLEGRIWGYSDPLKRVQKGEGLCREEGCRHWLGNSWSVSGLLPGPYLFQHIPQVMIYLPTVSRTESVSFRELSEMTAHVKFVDITKYQRGGTCVLSHDSVLRVLSGEPYLMWS